MRNYSTTGFLTDSRKTICFTISLDKPIVAEEIFFSDMYLQVRSIDGDLLIDEDVISGDCSVITQIKKPGVFVTITRSEGFNAIDNIPLSVYVQEANGVFV